uniref:Vitellogenin n=1 Tax=Conopomorpha sinensis TaxID=940481 RepID=A0A3G1S403_9NEOP|nr:vitellogenin [Conopomorpha sinensis]
MKVLVLAALLAAASCANLKIKKEDKKQGKNSETYVTHSLWQDGKVYTYDVESFNLASLEEGSSSGANTKATLQLRVRSQKLLHAKLVDVRHAAMHQKFNGERQAPDSLKYEPMKSMEHPFEIVMNMNRMSSMNLPSSLNLEHENFLKGILSTLQVDLTPYRKALGSHDYYDQERSQGQFRKMETDVTGDCETLYSVSPLTGHNKTQYYNDQEPIEITKMKDYGKCNHRVAYHFGVPAGAEWTGTAHSNKENQFMERATKTRIVTGQQGPIYDAETISTVYVNPLMYGRQKAEIYSRVSMKLVSTEDDSQPQFEMQLNMRQVKNLLYSLGSKSANIDYTSTSASSESTEIPEEIVLNEELDEQPATRVRRSPKQRGFRAVSVKKLVIEEGNRKYKDDSESDSSSDSSTAYQNDEAPKQNEPAYASIYMVPQSRTPNKRSPMVVQKLVQEFAHQLQNPNTMAKSDTISKFNVIVHLIATMNSEELTQTTRNIESAKSPNDDIKSDMVMAYRDAMTQAGTMPAFQQIKTWITTKKIQGEEAAQIMGSLAHTLRYPTKDLMSQFFNLAFSDEVREQRYLNTTALISAVKFINMGYVNQKMSRARYPTLMYGQLTSNKDKFVEIEILPRLVKELDEAIARDDKHKAQVMIKAMGTLGHNAILRAFAPYLEGEIETSTYLRRYMVENLDVLAYQKDHFARSVLYNIIRNTAETPEVRVAAIFNIFAGRPTSAMMHSMAYMTKEDPSQQVRSALRSAIETAAELKNPRYYELSRTAQEVKPLLTKEPVNVLSSRLQYGDSYNKDYELGAFNVLSYIGSENSLMPKYLKYSWTNQAKGYNNKDTMAVSLSDAWWFTEYLKDPLQIRRSYEPKKLNHKYTAKDVADLLKIRHDLTDSQEAAFYFSWMEQERYFAFSKYDFDILSSDMIKALDKLSKGVDYHYSKTINTNQVSVMFPLASGMPFIYRYKEPTLMHVKGKASAMIAHKDKATRSTFGMEMHMTYAKNLDGSVGFFDILTNHYSSVGVQNKLQFNVPIKIELEREDNELKIEVEPLHPEQDIALAHYSVWPYSARQKKDAHVTVAVDPTTKVIERVNKVHNIDMRFGQAAIGSQFQMQGYSYSTDYRNIATLLKTDDLLGNMAYIFNQKDIALTHYNLRYLSRQSPNKRMSISLVYDEREKKNDAKKPLYPVHEMADVKPNSETRRQEMADRVTTEVKASKAKIIDMSAVFHGAQSYEYVLTAAISSSDIETKTKYAIFYARNHPKQGNEQSNFAGSFTTPVITSKNFEEALKQESKSVFDGELVLGQKGNIRVNGYMERTRQYAEKLQRYPKAPLCAADKAQFNQRLCYASILYALSPDHIKANIEYKDVSPWIKNLSHNMYNMVRHAFFWYEEENILKTMPDGQAEIDVTMSYKDHMFNMSMASREGDMRIYNAPLPKQMMAVVGVSPVDATDEMANYFTQHQYLKYCSAERENIKTFSDKAYNYTMSGSWHVLLLDEWWAAGKRPADELVILARKPSPDEQEIYISYQNSEGEEMEIELKPDNVPGTVAINVKSSLTKLSRDGSTQYKRDGNDKVALEYFYLPDDRLMLNIREGRLRALYSGRNIVILAYGNQNHTRGLCGHMSGEPNDDFVTPDGNLVDEADQFAASYALDREYSDPKTKTLQELARKNAYQPRRVYPSVLRSDESWTKYNKDKMQSMKQQKQQSQSMYSARSYGQQDVPCRVENQVQYYETYDEICISTQRLPSCRAQCRGEGYIKKSAQVVCKSKMDEEFKMYKEEIKQGQNPEVSGPPKKQEFRVPSSCME